MLNIVSVSISGWLLFSVVALGQLPTSSDFVYMGAFRLPDVVGSGQYVNAYGQRGMTFDVSGDPSNGDLYPGSLWITGHDYTKDVYEVTIPEPSFGQSYGSLNRASILTSPVSFTDGCNRGSDWLSGLELHDSRFWASCAERYNVTGHDWPDIIWSRDLNLEGLEGSFHAGPMDVSEFHSNRQGAYLFSIPQDFADSYLGGKSLATGMVRNSHGGGPGPTFLAFDPEDPSDGYDMFWYRPGGTTQCSESHICDFPDYTPCDEWNGAAWVNTGSGEALMLSGAKYYGEVIYDGGWECNPGYAEILFYDPADFADRVNGQLEPWEVLPYETWRPEERWATGGRFGGMTYDQASGLLYVIEKSIDSGRSIVHVYQTGVIFVGNFEQLNYGAWTGTHFIFGDGFDLGSSSDWH